MRKKLVRILPIIMTEIENRLIFVLIQLEQNLRPHPGGWHLARMSPSNQSIRNQLDDFKIGSATAEAKLDNRAHLAGTRGIRGPPFRKPVIGSQQFVNLCRATFDSNTMPDLSL